MATKLVKNLLKKLQCNDKIVTACFQKYNRKTALISTLNAKQIIANNRTRKAETHTKYLLGCLILKSELHLKFFIQLGEDLTDVSTLSKVDKLLVHLEGLKKFMLDEQLHLPTLASKGSKMLSSNGINGKSLSHYTNSTCAVEERKIKRR